MRFIVGSFCSGGAWGCDVRQWLSLKHHVQLLNSEVLIVGSWPLSVWDIRPLLVKGRMWLQIEGWGWPSSALPECVCDGIRAVRSMWFVSLDVQRKVLQ